MKKDEIILEGLGDSVGNEFTDLINIRVADIAFPARKTGFSEWNRICIQSIIEAITYIE